VVIAAAASLAGAAQFASLRIASAFDPQTMDPQTMDPHALALLLYHLRVAFQIYDSLVTRDEQFKLHDGLTFIAGRAPDMARQSAMQHIGILEAAKLVSIVLAWRGDIVAQKGSAMIFALSAALYGRVDIEASTVPQGTFNDRQPSA
jgi:hypothetical protein